MKSLHFTDYADEIRLFEEFRVDSVEGANKEGIVNDLLEALHEIDSLRLNYAEKRKLLHAKINVLRPNAFGIEAVKKLDQLLQIELNEKSITDANSLLKDSAISVGSTKMAVWQGDISTLKADVIVNAANDQLLGCCQPLHMCIDNVIHTAAGVQLRDDCNIIMQKQGFSEPTGEAKITRAYNLPSKYVLHTVGPVVVGQVSDENRNDLAKAYVSCLEVCREISTIKSIAFCCISTGVFGYPAEQAAFVAFNTVKHWLENHQSNLDIVVFNVFRSEDKVIYESIVKCM
ncbi:protein-ADP-ribose hydrolase [Saccharicrinis fermentans]|uniref:O-acetyl-ADP-ribose deacetylase n=1 Tax=Saccharicrinis fermentans DSM 9555 = JCM 21142 TaxID=869213 RepID=W7XW35_9BACT|nr:protein-ADP-ribose hydrolase [Saccharicrinis fermentans]GAF02485.1 O-acetyl-ADP-ribose deacetylase [Saccharicrinis fermentans DSM 9555 = JCM 21142]